MSQSVGPGPPQHSIESDVPFIQALADALALALDNVRFRQRRGAAPEAAIGSGAEDEILRTLTDRELQVLHLIGEGLTNREVGERLSVSIRTIEWHRSNLLAKLGASQRSELIATARRLVPTPPGQASGPGRGQ